MFSNRIAQLMKLLDCVGIECYGYGELKKN